MLRRALTANDERTAGLALHALTSFGARATTLLVGMYRTNPLARKLIDEKFKEPLPASVSLQYTHFERTRRIRRALAPIAEEVNLHELNGSDPAVHAQALKNICQSQSPAYTVVPLLADVIKDPTHSLRPLALEGLGRFYAGQLPSLKSELADLSHSERLKLESNANLSLAIAIQTAGIDSDERFYRTRSAGNLDAK